MRKNLRPNFRVHITRFTRFSNVLTAALMGHGRKCRLLSTVGSGTILYFECPAVPETINAAELGSQDALGLVGRVGS